MLALRITSTALFAGVLLFAPAAAQTSISGAPQPPSTGPGSLRPASEASFENGHFRESDIGFDVPANWKYEGTRQAVIATDETAGFTDPQTGLTVYAWLSRQTADAADIPLLLERVVANKARQREREGYRQWHARPDSVQQSSINGHAAVSAIADFESRSGTPRVECLTWIYAPERRVQFFAVMSPDQFAAFQPQFDRMARSATLP